MQERRREKPGGGVFPSSTQGCDFGRRPSAGSKEEEKKLNRWRLEGLRQKYEERGIYATNGIGVGGEGYAGPGARESQQAAQRSSGKNCIGPDSVHREGETQERERAHSATASLRRGPDRSRRRTKASRRAKDA